VSELLLNSLTLNVGVKFVQDEMARQKRTFEGELGTVVAAQKAELRAMHDKHQQELMAAESGHAAALRGFHQEAENELNALKLAHADKIKEAKERYEHVTPAATRAMRRISGSSICEGFLC
jgi:hypothetical protein